jgi:hypothetical protein
MKKLWAAFAAVLIASFAVLGWAGVRIYQPCWIRCCPIA